MSAKPSRRLFVNRRITGVRHERNWRALSVAGFIFTYVRRYFSGLLTGGGGGRSVDPPLYGRNPLESNVSRMPLCLCHRRMIEADARDPLNA